MSFFQVIRSQMIGGTAQPIVIQTAPIQARKRHVSSQITTCGRLSSVLCLPSYSTVFTFVQYCVYLRSVLCLPSFSTVFTFASTVFTFVSTVFTFVRATHSHTARNSSA
jgi:hypothetical protein